MASTPPGRRWPAYLSMFVVELATAGALMVPIAVAVPRRLAGIRTAESPWTLEQGQSQVFVVAALVSLSANILFGWLSDRARRGPAGRLPFLPLGTVAGGLCLWQAGHAPTLGLLTVWFALAVFGYNATLAALFGTFADLVEGTKRSSAAGWLAGVANGATAVPLAIFALVPITAFSSFGLFPLAALAATLGAIVVLYPYVRALHAAQQQQQSPGTAADVADADPAGLGRRWRGQFWLLVLQRGIAQLAFVFGGLFALLFLVRRVGLDPADGHTGQVVSAAAAATALASMVAAVGAGYLAARTRNSLAPMRVGLLVMTVGLVLMAFATTISGFVAAKLLIALGAGAYLGCDLGLAFRVVPPGFAGRYLGFFNVARSLPQTIAPAIGPLLLALGSGDRIGVDRSQNYTAFFLIGAAISVLALIATAWIRVRSADTPGSAVPTSRP